MKFYLFLFVVLFGFANAPLGHASQCVPGKFDDIVKQADVIFIGKVIEKQRILTEEEKASAHFPLDCGGKTASFDVYKVWKGEVKKGVTVYSKDACLDTGSYFMTDNLYVVFANTHPKVQFADFHIGDLCDGTTNVFSDKKMTLELIKNLDERFKTIDHP